MQTRLKLGLLLVFCAIAIVEGAFDAKKLRSSRPESAPVAFDCKARELALKYAQKLQPWRNFTSIYDGLELGSLCNQTSAPEQLGPVKKPKMLREPKEGHGPQFWVDAAQGSDSNPGTLSSPFKSIQRAVFATRAYNGPKTIWLRAGVFYLNETIQLGPEDSYLTISNYKDEEVFVSGGIPLQTTWKAYDVWDKPRLEVFTNYNNVYGQANFKGDTTTIKFLGMYSNAHQCQQACLNYQVGDLQCNAFTFIGNGTWKGQCFATVDDTWGPVPQQDVVSGRVLQMNVYVASLQGQGIKSITGLQLVNGGKRATRARFPNADVETSFFPNGWIPIADGWLPAKNYSAPLSILVDSPRREDITMFAQYTIGIGGPCAIFDPPESYWCSNYSAGGGAGMFETPQGLIYTNGTFMGKDWKNPKGAIVHVWHPAHWAMWMYELDSYDPETRTLGWSYGGFQGARGAAVGNGAGGEWYIENVFEELDAPNEFYYDQANELLYYFYNGTTAPPSDMQFVATNLKVLFDVEGSMNAPVRNLTLNGLNFAATAYTYMDPHGVPSGGDWAMQRSGALKFEGTEHLLVQGCLFARLDGNGLILLGYHRNATVFNNEFKWTGDSPMVAWGNTEGMDGTNGDQPRFTNILYNLVHEVGLYEKQASPWFQAKTCQSLIEGNIMFNGPRAMINFNDGFGGANEIRHNLMFNPNRETSDQGPFNSWDRMPFLTDVLYGTPSLTPAYNNIHHNFMICNYGSDMCIDNDDGSAYYLLHDNFEVYGGHKSDFGGHNKFTYNTLVAYAQDYENGLCGDFNAAIPGYVDGYWNNSCVQGAVVPYITIDTCNATAPNPEVIPILKENKVYNAAATLSVKCGNTILTETEFQALGFDKGTKVYPLPTDDEVMSWGRAILGF